MSSQRFKMRITFAVVVCIFFCATEANDFKPNMKFCLLPKQKYFPEGTELPIVKYIDGPPIVLQPNDLLRKDQLYPGMTLKIAKTIIADRTENDRPYISEKVEDGILYYRLREVRFEPCWTKRGSSGGIRFTAVFEEKRWCRIFVTTEVVSRDKIYGFEGSEILGNYLKTTDFETTKFTKHTLEWIEEAFKNGGTVSSSFKEGYWTQEYTNNYHFLAEIGDIHNFLEKMGSLKLASEKMCHIS